MKPEKNDIHSFPTENRIEVYGAREHNLKDVNVVIPRDTLTVINEDTGALTLPEAARGLRIAHCYIADGGELPELDGKLLYSDSSAAWFQLDNNMSTLQNTLNALEKSGCTVTAYEDIGLTLDSRADSWLLIVRN